MAVALAAGSQPVIVNASDTDWWTARLVLAEHGVFPRLRVPGANAGPLILGSRRRCARTVPKELHRSVNRHPTATKSRHRCVERISKNVRRCARRCALKIPWGSLPVSVRFRPPAPTFALDPGEGCRAVAEARRRTVSIYPESFGSARQQPSAETGRTDSSGRSTAARRRRPSSTATRL